MPGNIGFLYYKKYYHSLPEKVYTAVNNEIENMREVIPVKSPNISYPVKGIKINDNESKDEEDGADIVTTTPIKTITTYPGLTIGTGYIHEAHGNDNAYKIGFHFDFTTGMPVIPGHSVKGVLRSVFPNAFKKDVSEEYRRQRRWFVNKLLENIIGDDFTELDSNQIDKLEEEIFAGVYNGKSIPVYRRDLFLDAIPVDIPYKNYKGNEKRLFFSDYITPHKNRDGNSELDQLSSPNPIKFLKVMPGVQYEFHFRLFPSKVYELLDSKNKLALFKQILLTLGIGAKTNVGYGQFK